MKFSLKTVLATSIGAGVIGGLVALPARSESLARSSSSGVVLSQLEYGNSYQNESNSDLKNVVGLTGLAIATGATGYYLSRIRRPSLAGSLPTVGNRSNNTLLSSVSPKLRRELLRLVHDRNTADRLLSGTYDNHPDRSANWIAEKVIYDLKRGR